MFKLLKYPLTLAFIFIFGFLVTACQPSETVSSQTSAPAASPVADRSVAYTNRTLSASPAQLPPLPYPASALSKAIDAETMRIHHDRHHKSYVDNLNSALKDQPNLRNLSIEAMLRHLNAVPESIRQKVRNNAGGHLNHTIFWQIMSPNGGGQPTGAISAKRNSEGIAQAINQTFGSFENFRKQFNQAGSGQLC